MKKFFQMLIFIVMITACAPQNNIADNKEETSMAPSKNEDGEWDLEVLDTQYNYYLNAVAKPMSQYTESSLKARNANLVSQWNSLFFSGRHRNVIESSIDYDPNENYGLKFEYKLYQVFTYVQWKYGLRLNGVSQADVR